MPKQHSPEDLPLFQYAKKKEAEEKAKGKKITVIETPGGKHGKITITEDATKQTWEGLHPSDDTDDVWKK